MARRRGASVPKPKSLKIELLSPTDKPVHEPYKLMREIRKAHHPDLEDAKIAIAWMIDVKPDKDGHIPLGRMVLASELQRELVDWDFVLLLNRDVWQSQEFAIEKKRALLDHELQHGDVVLDRNSSVKKDAKGRILYRIRKHDIEEFHCIARRHGIWKSDLERFAEALMASKAGPLFATPPPGTAEASTPLTQ
jgi:hypothetical protein